MLDSEVLANLMWSDPTIDGCDGFVVPSRVRGPGFGCLEFGPDIVHAFCARNRIDLIVRGHQVAQNGYDLFAGGRLITGTVCLSACVPTCYSLFVRSDAVPFIDVVLSGMV